MLLMDRLRRLNRHARKIWNQNAMTFYRKHVVLLLEDLFAR